jgi:hypothetical protein
MSSDIEESARAGMRQFTATMRVSPDLAARTCKRHRRRTRHKLTALATGTATAAAGAALAVTALIPAGRQPDTQLAAWTVVKQADGNVYVTIREFRDPAGLQARLRADGVPASVIFNPKLPRGAPFRDLFHVKHNPCQAYSGGQGQLLKVVGRGSPHPLRGQSTLSIIHPSALPSGAGVQFIATPNTGYQNSPERFALGVLLVQTSRNCTGS